MSTRRRSPYIITSDNDGHHYVIPKACEDKWSKWLDIPSDDERSWDVPDYAEAVGGSPTLVSFPSYDIR